MSKTPKGKGLGFQKCLSCGSEHGKHYETSTLHHEPQATKECWGWGVDLLSQGRVDQFVIQYQMISPEHTFK